MIERNNMREVTPELGQDPSFKDWLKELLNEPHKNITVVFTKSNGEDRTMTCTTNPTLIPEEKQPKGVRTTESDDVQRVFDLNVQEWRSFRWDTLKTVEFEL